MKRTCFACLFQTLTTCGVLTLALLFAPLLIEVQPAQAQTEAVLYNFTGNSDGGWPQSNLTSDGAGNFYGTTYIGGFGYGTVFELSPNGSGGWNETVLQSFWGEYGMYPFYSYVIFDNVGNLYGTAYSGGANGEGVVFELSPVGTSWTETALHNFGWTDGAVNPVNGLIMDSAGNLYGTTSYGGGQGIGAVFELSPSGGGWTEQVIYNQQNPTYAGLTMDAAGNIFGVSASTVFELSPNGNGGWNSTVIHTFAGGGKDGSNAEGTPVIDKAGNLYGTTYGGGSHDSGTVYKLSPITTGKNKGQWKEKILHSFGSRKDGSSPWAGVVLDAAGNIYGTTLGGGKYGSGTVFELVAPVGKGSYKKRILWSFDGTDGYEPFDSLFLDGAGNLYGTTYGGGSSGYGVVFELTPLGAR